MNERCPFLAGLRYGLTGQKGAGQGVLLAVSGGADSMAMLHGIRVVADEMGIGRIEVAHLNHGLRGLESEADLELVRSACGTAGIFLTTESLAFGNIRANSKGSIEESARSARYEFLKQTAASRQLQVIATAHHQQDQIETILFSLLRGTGIRGLQGIPAQRSLSPNVTLIRPMLTVDRACVRRYVQLNSIGYREDLSNATPEFTRNRIRILFQHLPAELLQKLEARLLALSQQASATIVSLDHVSDAILNESLIESTSSLLRFDRMQLAQWGEPLVRYALILQWSLQNWPRKQMNAAQWQRLSNAALLAAPRRWSFPGGVRLLVRRSVMELLRIEFP